MFGFCTRSLYVFFAFAPLLAIISPPQTTAHPAQQSQSTEISRIYVDAKSGRIHIVDVSMKDVEVLPDKDQVDAAQPKLADDNLTAGWLIESKVDDGTSYPIPLCLAIYREGRVIRRFTTGMAIGDWQFVNAATQVAFSTNTLHGDHPAHFELRDVLSGKLLSQYDQDSSLPAPDWTKGISGN